MGTHPIFESDFDCLTALFREKQKKWPTSKRNRKSKKWSKIWIYKTMHPTLMMQLNQLPKPVTKVTHQKESKQRKKKKRKRKRRQKTGVKTAKEQPKTEL